MQEPNQFDVLDFRSWLDTGIGNGWIEEPVCYHHDALPSTPEEEAEIDEGGDPCMLVIRLWDL